MPKDLLEGVIAGFSLLLIIMLIERIRFAAGKEMLIDKFIAYLESIHRRTAPQDNKETDIREYALSDKVKVMELYFHKEMSGFDSEGESNNLQQGVKING